MIIEKSLKLTLTAVFVQMFIDPQMLFNMRAVGECKYETFEFKFSKEVHLTFNWSTSHDNTRVSTGTSSWIFSA